MLHKHHWVHTSVALDVTGDTGTPGAMFGPGMMGPPPGPLHGWPTHGMLGPGPSGGRNMRHQQPAGAASWIGGRWVPMGPKEGTSAMAGESTCWCGML